MVHTYPISHGLVESVRWLRAAVFVAALHTTPGMRYHVKPSMAKLPHARQQPVSQFNSLHSVAARQCSPNHPCNAYLRAARHLVSGCLSVHVIVGTCQQSKARNAMRIHRASRSRAAVDHRQKPHALPALEHGHGHVTVSDSAPSKLHRSKPRLTFRATALPLGANATTPGGLPTAPLQARSTHFPQTTHRRQNPANPNLACYPCHRRPCAGS